MKEEKKSIWKVDLGHSNVQFKVRHMAIAQVSGMFSDFKGQIENENSGFEGAKVNFEISAASINTNNTQRDEHLRSDLFFDVEQYPKLIFSGNLDENYQLTGLMTIHGVTKEFSMDVDFSGRETGRFGENRVAFEVDTKLNRKDYGLTWNMLTEAGGLMVGEEIKLHMDLQFIEENLNAL